MIKFTPKFIGVGVDTRPTIIVGEKPNKTRDKSTFSLIGNRTGDFVLEAIGERSNIILTNVTNVYYDGKFDRKRYLDEGIVDLIELIELWEPDLIICLGSIAKEFVESISIIPNDCKIFTMPHPSYINRFLSKQRSEYIQLLSNELDKRISANTQLG